MEERLQKILGRAGYGSRKGCEDLIAKGHVTVNGRIGKIGTMADPSKDQITVNDKLINSLETLRYIAVNKPRNVISATSSQDNRKTVRELVNEPGHLYPVGRLDIDCEENKPLTIDGDLTNRLTHPRFGHDIS